MEKIVNGELSLKGAKKLLQQQIMLKRKKAKEIAAKELADGASAKSNDAKPREIKEISIKQAKHLKAAAKQPRPRKRKAEIKA